MSRVVVFETPGLLDLRSFAMFGVNVKPNSVSPIGFFGTGAKYAIATMIRLKAEVVVWIGMDRHTFSLKPVKFRETDIEAIRMQRRRFLSLGSSYTELPFTTALGRNWLPWMAYREFEANTRDEGGVTTLCESLDDAESMAGPGRTVIAVAQENFVQAHLDRDDIFLPGAMAVRESGARVQIIERPANRIYYRGLRVFDLKKPSLFTYNFLSQQDLTEDRTLKYEFMAQSDLARHIATSEDEGLIESVITASDQSWESGINFDYQSEIPSAAFKRVMQRRRGAVSHSTLRYFAPYEARSPSRLLTTWERHPRPWVATGNVIRDGAGQLLLTASESERCEQLATDVVDLINRYDRDGNYILKSLGGR